MTRRRLVTGPRLVAAFLLTTTVLAVPLLTGPLGGQRVTAEVPLPRPAAALTNFDRTSAERQSAILAAEDQRLLTLVASVRPGSAPYTVTLDDEETLVLTAGGLAYDLDDLVELGAAEVESNDTVLLTKHVFVAPDARLVIDAPGTTLRLRSEESGFATLVSWKADLLLAGNDAGRLRVTSWDPESEAPDEEVEDGRAYVREVSGDMTIRDAGFAHLGFWAGRTGGVAWTGNSSTVATGSVVDATFRDSHYGAFASQGEDLEFTRTTFVDNTVDGLSLHRSTAETTIRASAARGNGRHGFSTDHASKSVTYTSATAARNGAYGIFFSGTPLAEGMSAGGASLEGYGHVTIEGGELWENGKAGARVVDGDHVVIRDTNLVDNRDGIVLVDTAAPTTVEGVTLRGDHRFGISVEGGAATVEGNEVTGGGTAIRVRDAAAEVSGNTVAAATAHGISVVGRSAGTSVQDNTIGGRGPSGLDTFRVPESVTVDVTENDVEGWETDRDNWTYWSTFIPNHPMLLLWVVVLGLPLGLTLRARRHRVAPGTAPYGDDLRRERSPALRVDVGRRATASGRPA
ncbi:right-handed parallel beta-helix repeat-containing protein [Geodermatophilus sp. SYSU D00708]